MEIMSIDYLHNHKEFQQLLNIISEETNIIPQLIEKDYWIMHVLHGLTKLGFEFELKGVLGKRTKFQEFEVSHPL